MPRRINRRLAVTSILGAAGAMAAPAVLRAQAAFPNRTVRIVVPVAPGGGVDTISRLIANKIKQLHDLTFIVENRTGGNSTIGGLEVQRAAPDGYTVLFHSATFSASYVTHKWLPYDTLGDFTAVSPVGISPSVLVASPKKGYKTVAELVAAAKANPGKLDFASAGIGAASHLSAEKFNVAAGIKAQHVPFKGPVDALSELMAGRIDYYFLPLAAAITHIKAGNVTPLAVSSDKRAPQLPDVPTVAEVGYPAAAYAFWNGLFVPVKTPPDIVAKLYQETQKAVTDPTVKERLDKVGVQPLLMTQPEFQKYFEADVKDTEKLAQAAGIQKQ
jgi:tripartite-type tricarboxylate transporter receptor subunit TctC